MKQILFIAFFIMLLSNLSAQLNDDPLYKQAVTLAHKYIILDGHVDLPYRLQTKNFRLEREFLDIPIETDKGDFDYKRAKEGGLDAPFMSVFIPSSYQEEENGGAKKLADELIDMINGIIAAHPDKFASAFSPDDIERNFQQGLISLPMGMENGAPLLSLSDIRYFYKRGIRYVTLTHGKNNHICDSSYDTTRTWNGLSPYGREVVAEMNDLGMMIDVSHVSDETFYQVIELSIAPVIASHSSCRDFTPGWERNMDDDMILALGKNGGVIQINFGSSFLDEKIRHSYDVHRDSLNALLKSKGLNESDEAAKPFIDEYRKANPNLFADVETVADHIGHVLAIAGIDHVGLGSDFDGVGDSLPTGLKDVSDYPNLIYVLLKRGYSEEDIAKICYGNVFRVWRAVEELKSK
ncbi:MAG TPA: dipeptidase [Saprospiraceae bacterium]|nr:dipeptidase [Saprospiraceae bacterium]